MGFFCKKDVKFFWIIFQRIIENCTTDRERCNGTPRTARIYSSECLQC